MLRSSIAAFVIGLALCRADAVCASVFRVAPVQVVLSKSEPSALLTVSNDSGDEMRLQVSAAAWDENPDGTMKLTPTKDVVFFPMMLTLAPGAQRSLRVGLSVAPGPVEKTYRIFVEELPPAGVESGGAPGLKVRVLTKMGIPVFLQPAQPAPSASVVALGATGDRLRFAVRNGGNSHFTLQDVRMIGMGRSGERVFDRRADGWYVLAGGQRDFEQSISYEECTRLTAVDLETETDRGTLTTHVPLTDLVCEPSAQPGEETNTR